ncbi:MAG: hypothetical protein WB508_06870 [Aeromicrobium sp.]
MYLPAGSAELRRLVAGGAIQVEGFLAVSTDEEDELGALEAAGEEAGCVVVAEVSDPDGPVDLDDVEALHVDIDDSGALAWFGTQEIAAVIELVRAREAR